jgi:hypothetical protein
MMEEICLEWLDRFKKVLADDTSSEYYEGFFISPFKFWLSKEEYQALSFLEKQHNVEISKNFLLDLYDNTIIIKIEDEKFIEYKNKDVFLNDLQHGFSSEKVVFALPEFKVFIELRSSFEVMVMFFLENKNIGSKLILNINDNLYVVKDHTGIRFEKTLLLKRESFFCLSKTTHQKKQYIRFLFDDLIKAIECGDIEKWEPKFISIFDRWLERSEVHEKLDGLSKEEHAIHTKKILDFFKEISKEHSIYAYISSRSDFFLLENQDALDIYIDNTYDKFYKDKPIFLVPSLALLLMLSTDHTVMFFYDELADNTYLYEILKKANLNILET